MKSVIKSLKKFLGWEEDIFKYVRTNNLDSIRNAIEEWVQVNSRDQYWRNILIVLIQEQWCIYDNRFFNRKKISNFIKELIKFWFNFNIQDIKGNTALIVLLQQLWPIKEEILNFMNISDPKHKDAENLLKYETIISLVQILLENWADITIKNNNWESAVSMLWLNYVLMRSSWHEGLWNDLINLILKHSQSQYEIAHSLLSYNALIPLESILKNNYNVNWKYWENQTTLLMSSVIIWNLEGVQLLMKYKSDPYIISNAWINSIQYAKNMLQMIEQSWNNEFEWLQDKFTKIVKILSKK